MKTKPILILSLLVCLALSVVAQSDGRTAIPAAARAEAAFLIDQPGSYYLAGNHGAAGTAIKVLTNNVTIDLNGFCLIGSETGKTHGVFLNGVRNVEIRNGTIMNFGDRAVAGEGRQEGVRILNVRIIDNGACGICLDVGGLYMKDCYVSGNKMTGICPGVCATLLDNIVSSNGHAGVLAGWGCLIQGNNIYRNQRSGISANYNSRVENNLLVNNNLSAMTNEAGIVVSTGVLVRNNVLRDNKLAGIRVLKDENRIEGNLITYGKKTSGTAIFQKPGSNNEIIGNYCSTNCSSNPQEK